MHYQSPGTTLDYLHDVTSFLATGETVSSAVWTLETGLTGSGQVETTTGSTIDITTSDTLIGKACRLRVEMTTNQSNTFKRDWFIKIQHQLA